jgi:ABC-type uncharacterized transport system fused permease/ATPase subunit
LKEIDLIPAIRREAIRILKTIDHLEDCNFKISHKNAWAREFYIDLHDIADDVCLYCGEEYEKNVKKKFFDGENINK